MKGVRCSNCDAAEKRKILGRKADLCALTQTTTPFVIRHSVYMLASLWTTMLMAGDT